MRKIGLVAPIVVMLFLSIIIGANYLKIRGGYSDARADRPIKKYSLPEDEPIFTKCKTWPKNLNLKRCENHIEVCYFNRTDISCYPKEK